MSAHLKTALTVALVLTLGTSSLALAAAGDPQRGDRAENREEMFNRFDSDGDGQVSREDLDGLAESRFSEADANSDGFLSEEELRASAEKRMSERAERMSARMLERLDENGDGQISLEEMSEKGNRGERFFERADADGDGVVTRTEFLEMEPRKGRPFGQKRN